MPRQPKYKSKKRSDRKSHQVIIPKALVPHMTNKDGKRSNRRSFPTTKQADEFNKLIKKLTEEYGRQIKIPTVKQLVEYQEFVNKVGDKDIDEVIEVGVTGAEARQSSVLLKDLKPFIETAISDKEKPLDGNYKTELLRNVDKLIEIWGDDKYVSDFTPEMIDQHIDNPKLAYSLNHKSAIKRHLSGLFKVAVDNNLINKNPVHDAKRRGTIRNGVEIYRMHQIKRLVEESTPEMEPVMICCFAMGLRPCEVRRLKWEHINFSEGKAYIPVFVCKGSVRGKTVHISDNWMAHLLKYEGRTGYVSPLPETPEIKNGCRKERKSLGDKYRRQYWNKNLKKCGMWEERIQDGTRHTFGTMTYWFHHNAGVDGEDALNYVKQQLGHYDQKGNTAIDHYVTFEDLGSEPQEYFSYFPSDGSMIGSIKKSGLKKSGTD